MGVEHLYNWYIIVARVEMVPKPFFKQSSQVISSSLWNNSGEIESLLMKDERNVVEL